MSSRRLSSVPLVGPWRFRQASGPTSKLAALDGWMPATVPGCVHTDLFALGKIADPFYAQNERDQQWVEACDWDYETTFAADDDLLARRRVDLVFDGLDTYADVMLNGTLVLHADNMFRPWRVEVTAHLVPGANRLAIRFRSPVLAVRAAYDALGYALPASNDQGKPMVSMLARKAPYHYGWDWGPRFVTSGVWRPARLEGWDDARIDDVHVVQTELTTERARLRVRATVMATGGVDATLTVAVGGEPASRVDASMKPGLGEIDVEVAIERPERWWPNGLGRAHLYDLEVVLAIDGAPVDARRVRVGLRTVEVIHREDADGKSFTVCVNGAPTFMKGANHIPLDNFLPRVSAERYRALLTAAAAANMNMVRVWGGGVYEDDRFYDLCDELGILVWQDFMFACSMYPTDDAFADSVRQEAIANVKRLRNHPCLALWAGNNEIEVAWQRWGWKAKFGLSEEAEREIWNGYERIFHHLLPIVLAEYDPSRFYTRSSPSANDDRVAPDTRGFGDMHYWGVWHAEKPYSEYAHNISRFMSEYGFQSFPEIATVARYATPADFRIDSPVMLAHQRHPRGNELVGIYMERDFRTPRDFASLLYVSQVLQAIIIQYAAEAHRRKMPYCAGSLYWQLCDCWPVASWSGIDSFGQWKALHHFARHFFAPVLVSVEAQGDAAAVHLVSDRRDPARVQLALRLVDFDGATRWSTELDCVLESNTSQVCFTTAGIEAIERAPADRVVLVAEVLEGGRRLSRALHYRVKIKDLALPDPRLTLTVVKRGDCEAVLRVTAPGGLAKNVRLSSTDPDGHFTDNYFDLLPGETVEVGWRGRDGAGFEVRSIRDTY